MTELTGLAKSITDLFATGGKSATLSPPMASGSNIVTLTATCKCGSDHEIRLSAGEFDRNDLIELSASSGSDSVHRLGPAASELMRTSGGYACPNLPRNA